MTVSAKAEQALRSSERDGRGGEGGGSKGCCGEAALAGTAGGRQASQLKREKENETLPGSTETINKANIYEL